MLLSISEDSDVVGRGVLELRGVYKLEDEVVLVNPPSMVEVWIVSAVEPVAVIDSELSRELEGRSL